ncbi:hypothetical protein KDY119_00118 [Luteimicrobium xylanilyticum]|uniref:Uncharacterized protein n=1 Tax=Luteimicrobium xylanilyticum TaxID=1133546 RepID=A0A5P9Q5I6_9MICO|nr:hypothetical protein [Luteimicrobium xylanilyticum]QFU96634.1 hypothetical protein KDY119_00118 [Luteimicrobium xylanilyticum]
MTGSVIRNVEVERPSGAVGRLWWLPAGGQGTWRRSAGAASSRTGGHRFRVAAPGSACGSV